MSAFPDLLKQLSSSSPNQSALYAEHIGELLKYIKIDREITNKIRKYLASDSIHTIILTGNAGDGKTTICNELSTKEVSIVPDFSALSQQDRKSLLIRSFSDKSKKTVIAANEGALVYSLKDLLVDVNLRQVVQSVNNCILGTEQFSENCKGMAAINLNKYNNSDDAIKLLEQFVSQARKHWDQIGKDAQRNLTIIEKPNFKERLKEIYDFLHYNGNHLTVRDILIHICYIFTGGVEPVTRQHENESNFDNLNYELQRLATESVFGFGWGEVNVGRQEPKIYELLANFPIGFCSHFVRDIELLYNDRGLAEICGVISDESRKTLMDLVDGIRGADMESSSTDADAFFTSIFPKVRRYQVMTSDLVSTRSLISQHSFFVYYDDYKNRIDEIENSGVSVAHRGVNKKMLKNCTLIVKKLLAALNKAQAMVNFSPQRERLQLLVMSELHPTVEIPIVLQANALSSENFIVGMELTGGRMFLSHTEFRDCGVLELDYGLYQYLMALNDNRAPVDDRGKYLPRISKFLNSLRVKVSEMSDPQYTLSSLEGHAQLLKLHQGAE